MKRIYTKENVISLLANERLRHIHLCSQMLEKLRNQLPNAKGEVAASIQRAHGLVRQLYLNMLGDDGLDKKLGLYDLLKELVERDYHFLSEPQGKPIDDAVFPSEERTISVVDDEIYGGAHCYFVRECLGFVDGNTKYTGDEQMIQFVHKSDHGTIVPGLQSEQLVLVLLDRHQKLNNRFPSEQNAKMVEGLQMFLDACKERVQERIERGVMGELKK